MTRAQIEAEIRRRRLASWAKAKREGKFYGPKAPLEVRALERQTEQAWREELQLVQQKEK